MDRVGFLIEQTGERLGCLLNPESLEITRHAGVRPRRSLGGSLTGRGLSDDPLVYTGGGLTEIKLDVLFDVTLAGSSIQSANVRDLTAPFWALAENVHGEDGYGRAAVVRFVWGKVWNIPAVVVGIAERFEHFTSEGIPQRSWMRMRLWRVAEPEVGAGGPGISSERTSDLMQQLQNVEVPPDQVRTHTVVGGTTTVGPGGQEQGTGERLDEIAQRIYGDASLWRLLAAYNGIDDPLHLSAGLGLRLPPLASPPTP